MPDACRTCRATVTWALTPAGKRSPIDTGVAENGNVMLIMPRVLGDVVLAITLSGETLELARRGGAPLHLNHWATCVDKEEWRAKQDAKKARVPRGEG